MQCAVDIQRGMGKRNASVPRQKRVEFRFGVSYGELITDGDWVYGEGVAEAMRVEREAEPGGICLTEGAVEEVRGAVGFPFEATNGGVFRVPKGVLAPPAEDTSKELRPTLHTRSGATPRRGRGRPARLRKRRLLWSAGAAGLLMVIAGGAVSIIEWDAATDQTAREPAGVTRAALETTVATAPARRGEDLGAVRDALRRGDVGEAERLLDSLVGSGEGAAGVGAPNAGTPDSVGLDFVEVESLFRRLIDLKERDLGLDNPGLAPTLAALAAFYAGQGRHADAEPLYRRALAIRERALGPDHADVAQTREQLAAALRAMGRSAEAPLGANRVGEQESGID